MVTGKKLFIAILLVAAVVLVFLAPKAAVNVDEMLHYPHARRVVNWYFTGGQDKSNLDTPITNLKYYGQSVDNFTALVNRVFNIENEFLVRHYTGAFFFILLLLFTGWLSREITGSWLIAAATLLALLFMPRLAGQAFGNLKDIPFSAGYVAGIFLIIRCLKEFPVIRWKTAIMLGIAIAFTVSVRAGGFILFAYLGLAFLGYFALKPFYLIQIVTTKPGFVRLLGQGAAVLVIGYFTGLLFWPYALQNIFVHPFESLKVMEHYKVSIRQVYEGQLLWSTDLPWYYLPNWLLISTPMFVLLGVTVYLILYLREFFYLLQINRQTLTEGFVLFSFVFPFIYVIVIGSNLYSGIRQMLFVLPPLTVLAVWGVYKLLVLIRTWNRFASYSIGTMLFIMLLWPLKHQAATFPVDYVYFNSLAGGNKSAWGRFEYDYYYHSVKEAVDYLDELVGEQQVIVAMNSNLSNYFYNKPNIVYQYTRFHERSSYDWDYGIFGLNYMHPDFLKKGLWMEPDVKKIFLHKGNPVAVLIKRSDKNDFFGISEIKNGNLHQGIELLEKALDRNKNNVWLYVNLAKAQISVGNKEGFKFFIENGKKIMPFYEPLLYLEAEVFFKEGMYEKAQLKLEQLLEINARYLPAGKLLEELRNRSN